MLKVAQLEFRVPVSLISKAVHQTTVSNYNKPLDSLCKLGRFPGSEVQGRLYQENNRKVTLGSSKIYFRAKVVLFSELRVPGCYSNN